MVIAFVIPPSPCKRRIIRLIDCSHEAKADYLWQPTDFMTISSLLGPSDTALLIDGTADRMDREEFLEEITPLKPDIIFFALSSVCWESDYSYFRKTKGLFGTIPFFVIGDIFREEEYLGLILKECDGVVFNPYLLDLAGMAQASRHGGLAGVWTEPGGRMNGHKEMTYFSGGVPRHELFLKKGYCFPFARRLRFATVTTVWGCPFSCTYCPDAKVPLVVRPYQDVLKELEYLKSLGVREIYFADKTFGFPRDNAVALLKGMRGFSWTCSFHHERYEKGLLELMYSAGCHTIIVGIETARPEAIIEYGRRTDKAKLNDLLSHASRLGMSICGDFIIGFEHEEEKDIMETVRYALSLPIDFASFNIAAPFPGTVIREKAMISGKMAFGREGYDSMAYAGAVGMGAVSGEGLLKLRDMATLRFYLRPAYIRRRLRKTVSFEHFLVQLRQMLGMFKNAWKVRIGRKLRKVSE